MSLDGCRIAQFSDLHLSTQDDGLSKGVDCWAQLKKMLNHLSYQESVQALVLTGDIAHDELRKTYECLYEVLQAQDIPYWLVPGNHDDPGLMREIFSEQVHDELESMSFCTVVDGVAVIGLDTHEPGSDGGYLSPATLDWFYRQCELNAESPVMVFMHHPPLDTGDDFFDSIGLRERDSFWVNMKRYPQVKSFGFGHLHRSLLLNEQPWVQGAPSTAFGMERTPDGWKTHLDKAGYLIWSWTPSGVKTEVLGQG